MRHGRGSPYCPWNPGYPIVRDAVRRCERWGCLLLEISANDIGEYFIMLMTVCAKPCAGGDAVLVEDTKGTEGLVARVTISVGLYSVWR